VVERVDDDQRFLGFANEGVLDEGSLCASWLVGLSQPVSMGMVARMVVSRTAPEDDGSAVVCCGLGVGWHVSPIRIYRHYPGRPHTTDVVEPPRGMVAKREQKEKIVLHSCPWPPAPS
jgi:hypothetical protein